MAFIQDISTLNWSPIIVRDMGGRRTIEPHRLSPYVDVHTVPTWRTPAPVAGSPPPVPSRRRPPLVIETPAPVRSTEEKSWVELAVADRETKKCGWACLPIILPAVNFSSLEQRRSPAATSYSSSRRASSFSGRARVGALASQLARFIRRSRKEPQCECGEAGRRSRVKRAAPCAQRETSSSISIKTRFLLWLCW